MRPVMRVICCAAGVRSSRACTLSVVGELEFWPAVRVYGWWDGELAFRGRCEANSLHSSPLLSPPTSTSAWTNSRHGRPTFRLKLHPHSPPSRARKARYRGLRNTGPGQGLVDNAASFIVSGGHVQPQTNHDSGSAHSHCALFTCESRRVSRCSVLRPCGLWGLLWSRRGRSKRGMSTPSLDSARWF